MVRRGRRGAGLLLVVALLPSCGQGGGSPGQAAGGDAPDSAASAPSPSLPTRDSLTDSALGRIERDHVQLVLPWGQNPIRRSPSEGEAKASLSEWEVRGRQEFDRLVFTFGSDDPMPGYEVEFVQGPIRPCGAEADLESGARVFLRVRFSAARPGPSVDLRDTSIRPRRNVKELHVTCEQGDRLEFVVGLASIRDYRLLEVRSPRRLVVDIRNDLAEG